MEAWTASNKGLKPVCDVNGQKKNSKLKSVFFHRQITTCVRHRTLGARTSNSGPVVTSKTTYETTTTGTPPPDPEHKVERAPI